MDMCGIEDLMANTVLVQAKSDNAHNQKWRKNFSLPTISCTNDMLKKLEIEVYNLMPESAKTNQTEKNRFEFKLFCEKQCIGKDMFTKFCRAAEPKIRNAHALMDAIWNAEIANESEREDAARCVANSYLLKDAPYEIDIISEILKKVSASVILSEEVPVYDSIKEMLAEASPTKGGEEKNPSILTAIQANKPDLVVAHLSGVEKRFYFIKMLLEQCKQQVYPYLVEEVYPVYKSSEQFKTFLRWKSKEKEPVIEEDFFPFRLLGRGGFGEVYAYQVKATGKMYACKKIDKKKMKQKHASKVVMAEKITLEMVNSPFVVSLSYAYENKNHLNLVMTLMGAGDLKFHIYEKTGDKKRGIAYERTKFYTAQITLGLDHLHAENILYRDMKPENVLLDDRGNVRIADLGLVCILGEGEKTSGRAGTVGFMAPEMLESKKYAYGVDWFALGCTIFEMIEGKGPFVSRGKNKRKMSVGATIEKTIHEEHTYKRTHADDDLLDIIDQLLEKDVNQRLAGDEKSAEPIKRHPYFSDMNWERLEAGLIPPPFVPDPNQVYAKDVSDIRLGSEAKGVVLTNEDKDFHKKFASGRVPIPWQYEMMETGLFQEVMERKPGSEKNSKSGGKQGKSKSSICALL